MVNFLDLIVILVHVVITLVTTCNLVLNINLILYIILCSESVFYKNKMAGAYSVTPFRHSVLPSLWIQFPLII